MIIDRIFLKFILVGLVNTLFGSLIMFLLYNIAGCGYWFSSAANYIAGSVLSFFLNKYFTFNVKKWSFSMILAFALTVAVSYFAAYKAAKMILFALLRDHPQKIRDNAALFAGMCFFTGLNYVGQRFIVFPGKRRRSNDHVPKDP
ncbi:MAG: GtrA family protein [Treponema sp.]|jgi:putative flippase GtrA|nr:GtrA family protein [Treponema sp.]